MKKKYIIIINILYYKFCIIHDKNTMAKLKAINPDAKPLSEKAKKIR